MRLGVLQCTEVLLDLPDYFRSIRGQSPSGFSALAPAVKRQLGPLAGGFDLSGTIGVAVPTGSAKASAPGYNPYVQFPWSRELGGGWGVSGMFTAFWFPNQPKNNPTLEPTFAIERQAGLHGDLFLEYVGDIPRQGTPSQIIDTGGGYRLTPTQQVDFHLGFGLNRNSPRYFFGIGYSFRFDGLFR